MRVPTGRGSECCANPERHEYELYLAAGDIDHSRTKTKSPRTTGICARFHKTALTEFYRIAFRKVVIQSMSCRSISMLGCAATMRCAHIKVAGVSAKPRCRLLLMQCQ